jgi:hypothetical protein
MPENYVRIVNEYACLLPNIVGVPTRPELQLFEEIIDRPYASTRWLFTFDLRFSDVFARMLTLYLNDDIELEEFLQWQTRNLEAACDSMMSRKGLDSTWLQEKWRELEPVRRALEREPEGSPL